MPARQVRESARPRLEDRGQAIRLGLLKGLLKVIGFQGIGVYWMSIPKPRNDPLLAVDQLTG